MKVIIENFKALKDFLHLCGRSHQISYAEVERSLFLAEATPGDYHDSGALEELHTVKGVSVLPFFFRVLLEFF